jgi:hypothetical protein
VQSKAEIEARLGISCASLAYPYGDHDGRVVEAAKAAAYVTACTLPDRFDSSLPLAWPRVGVYHADGAVSFALKVSPTVRALRSTWVVHALKVARRLLR